MRRLICTFVVRICHKQVFSWCGSFLVCFLHRDKELHSFPWNYQFKRKSAAKIFIFFKSNAKKRKNHFKFTCAYLISMKAQMSHPLTKPTKWHVRPVKTQISPGIRPVWSESSLYPWRKLGSLATHWASAQRRLWSDWVDGQADLSLRWANAQADLSLRLADAQADPSLCWVHSHFVGFVRRQLKCFYRFNMIFRYLISSSVLTLIQPSVI